jgi:hypothetical protein
MGVKRKDEKDYETHLQFHFAAGIAVDTVYATVGKKPALFRLLVEMAISGSGKAVPAEAPPPFARSNQGLLR